MTLAVEMKLQIVFGWRAYLIWTIMVNSLKLHEIPVIGSVRVELKNIKASNYVVPLLARGRASSVHGWLKRRIGILSKNTKRTHNRFPFPWTLERHNIIRRQMKLNKCCSPIRGRRFSAEKSLKSSGKKLNHGRNKWKFHHNTVFMKLWPFLLLLRPRERQKCELL